MEVFVLRFETKFAFVSNLLSHLTELFYCDSLILKWPSDLRPTNAALRGGKEAKRR